MLYRITLCMRALPLLSSQPSLENAIMRGCARNRRVALSPLPINYITTTDI